MWYTVSVSLLRKELMWMKSKNRGKIFSAVFYLAVLAVTLYYVFTDKNLGEILSLLSEANLGDVAVAVCAVVAFILGESVVLRYLLGKLGAKVSFWHCSLFSFIGFFYSAITPSASGGQPMQLYHMHKDGISAARGAAALAMELASFQAAAVTIAAIGLLRFHALILQTSGFAGAFLLLGFAVHLSLLALLLCAILSPRLLTRASALIAGLLQKLRACKAARLRAATGRWVEDYQNCAACLRDMPGEAVLLFLTSLLQLAALHSIPYWVSLSLGMQQVSLPQMLSIQAVLFLFVSVIPLPGGAGAGEGGFLLLFASIFSGGYLQSAMLLSRFASFYLPLLLSGIFLWIQNLRNSR